LCQIKEVLDRGEFIDLLEDLRGELRDGHVDNFDASTRSNVSNSSMKVQYIVCIFDLEPVRQVPSLDSKTIRIFDRSTLSSSMRLQSLKLYER
jgi:hypothetical protein